MRPRKPRTSATQYLHGVMVALALLLPTMSLAVLGTLWLWQNNALLIWGVTASAVALLIYGVEYWLVRRREGDLGTNAATKLGDDDIAGPETRRSPREQRAWEAVEELAKNIQPDSLDNRDAVLALGKETIEAVARSMHPGEKDPLWKFTVPEALVLVERVSGQLSRVVVDSVPLGDRLTVGQVLAVYRWRSLVNVAEKAYDLWRILRFVNPATAIAGELREKISGQLLDGMRSELSRRLARTYVREVGAAAIDLYSGRLRPDLIANSDNADSAGIKTTDSAAPLRILIVGQSGTGKSSLVNALSLEVQAGVSSVPVETANNDGFATYTLARDDVPPIHLIESPGLDTSAERAAEIKAQADQSDVIVWIVSAVRPDRAADVEALDSLRTYFAAQNARRAPQVLIVLSNIDRVRPFNEWEPPYDLTDPDRPKSRSISDAVEAVAEELKVEYADIIPVSTASGEPAYNVELVWARLMDTLDDARNVQLLRRSSAGNTSPIARSLWRQAIGAGRVLRKSLLDSKKS